MQGRGGSEQAVTGSERQTQKWKTVREPTGSPRMAEAIVKGWQNEIDLALRVAGG